MVNLADSQLLAAGVGAAIISRLSADPHRPGLPFERLAKVSPRIVGIAWHRDRYRIPAAAASIRLTRRAAERERRAARRIDEQRAARLIDL